MIKGLALAGLCIAAPLVVQPVFEAMDNRIEGPTTQTARVQLVDCQEDQPCWDCVDDGNRVCGPGNARGVPPGCYDDGGVQFAPWPCNAWQPSDGYRHGDGSITYPVDNHCHWMPEIGAEVYDDATDTICADDASKRSHHKKGSTRKEGERRGRHSSEV